jgi:phospholipid/cholesterol/gamma-HCH transport system substrate-binding protein
MKTRSMEISIGIALFIASIVLVVGLVWLSEQTVGWNNYELHIALPRAEGLKRGDPITVVGIKIGKVEEILFRNNRAEVKVYLQSDKKLARDSKFTLDSGGLLGGKLINITPGSSQDYLVDGELVEGEVAPGLMDLGPAVANLEDRLTAGAEALLSAENIDRMVLIVKDMQSTTSHLQEIISKNKTNIDATLINLKQGTGAINDVIDDHKGGIDTTVSNLVQASKRFDAISRELATTTTTLRDISLAIKEKRGSFGALVYERELYDNLMVTTKNLNDLIDDIKKQPQKYVHVSLF